MVAASGRAPAACALLLLLLLALGAVAAAVDASQEEEVSPGSPAPAPSPASSIDCGRACAARCQLSSRQNLCRRACGSCCARCHCVPPGTAGNHDVCPCYAAITTRGGRPKCP
ncbi:cypmaclein-like [Miscanthus floridulus]|uniref:cypmaclein-like n=1 Tax=Miscanthus floridulus TaxID=154761 RepID=UPI003459EC9E